MDDLCIYPSAGVYVGYGINGIEKQDGVNTLINNVSYAYDTNLFGRSVRRVTETNGNGSTKTEYYVDKKYNLGQTMEMANRLDVGWTVGLSVQYAIYTFGIGFERGLLGFDKDAVFWDSETSQYKGFYNMGKIKNMNFKVSAGVFF
jgi:hypothetical protein